MKMKVIVLVTIVLGILVIGFLFRDELSSTLKGDVTNQDNVVDSDVTFIPFTVNCEDVIAALKKKVEEYNAKLMGLRIQKLNHVKKDYDGNDDVKSIEEAFQIDQAISRAQEELTNAEKAYHEAYTNCLNAKKNMVDENSPTYSIPGFGTSP